MQVELDYLKLNEEEVYIIGHRNVDVDSILSGYLLSKLFSVYGIKNQFVLSGIVSKDTVEILEKIDFDYEKYYGDVPNGASVFLVDHYDLTASDLGQDKVVKVVGCIDHHPNDRMISYPFYQYEKCGCCAKIIFDLMGDSETERDEILTLLALMVDTCALRSNKVTKQDLEWADMIRLKDENIFNEIEQIGMCQTDMNSPLDVIATNGQKTAYFKKGVVQSSYIQVFEVEWSMVDDILNYCLNKVVETSIDMWCFLIVEFATNQTYEYRIAQDGINKVCHLGILSRGSDIMPNIEKMYS